MCNRRSRGVSLIRGKSRALRLTRLMFSWIILSPWSVDQSSTLTNTSLLLSPLKDQNREWGRGRGSCGWGRGGRRGHGCLQVLTLHHAFRLHYGFFQGIEEGSEPESDRSAAAEARHIKASGENFRWVVTMMMLESLIFSLLLMSKVVFNVFLSQILTTKEIALKKKISRLWNL